MLRCSVVSDFVTPWTVIYQVLLSMGFCKQEYWSGLLCPPSGDLLDSGIQPASLSSPALTGGLPLVPHRKPSKFFSLLFSLFLCLFIKKKGCIFFFNVRLFISTLYKTEVSQRIWNLEDIMLWVLEMMQIFHSLYIFILLVIVINFRIPSLTKVFL